MSRALVGATGTTFSTSCLKTTINFGTEKVDPREKTLMHVGTQRPTTNSQMLQYFKRHGVNNICGYPPHSGDRGYWTISELETTQELCAKHAINLDLVQLPAMLSNRIDRAERPGIMSGQSPERDRHIEDICTMIRNCSKVGIPAIKYNLSILGVLRVSPTPGRGGSEYSTWRLEEGKENTPFNKTKQVDSVTFWERITYFLQRIIPVAEEYKVRMACHPHDPGVPTKGFQGVDRVLGTVEGLKQFISIQENSYHGLNLCTGTVAGMLQDPRKQIHDVIRYFGNRKKSLISTSEISKDIVTTSKKFFRMKAI